LHAHCTAVLIIIAHTKSTDRQPNSSISGGGGRYLYLQISEIPLVMADAQFSMTDRILEP